MRVVVITESRTPNPIQKIAVHENLSLQLHYNIAVEFKYILYTIYSIIYLNFRINKYADLIIYAYSEFLAPFSPHCVIA